MNLNDLPVGFLDSIRPLLMTETDDFVHSYDETSLRGIRFRIGTDAAEDGELRGAIPYAKKGYYLTEESNAGARVLHEAGAYYIQEPSAMAAAAVLSPEDGDIVLDLCAAPGGKSTQLAMMADLKLLVSNEPIPSRAQILSRNIERMGIANACVTSAYPQVLSEKWPEFFDKILVDAPCSGEGMFRRHPETRTEWNTDSPKRCAERQKEILNEAAKMLRSGGRMVFSTCTFNDTENEGTVQTFLEEHPDFHLVPFMREGLPDAPTGMLRLWPHRFKGEGHFVALLEKDGEQWKRLTSFAADKITSAERKIFEEFAKEIGLPGDVVPNHSANGRLSFVPEVNLPMDKIRVLRYGLQLGEIRGRIFIPDHALALAVMATRQIQLDDGQAASFIHGDTLPCDESLKGYYAAVYRGYQLGFVKASGGQMKNHYPKGLRK